MIKVTPSSTSGVGVDGQVANENLKSKSNWSKQSGNSDGFCRYGCVLQISISFFPEIPSMPVMGMQGRRT
jgi:hypothetical protein